MDNQSLAHSKYNCTYHIVFIPKYRRKVMFGNLRREVGEAISKVCKMEGVTIIKAATLPDHVHMYVSIPPKLSVAKAVPLNLVRCFVRGIAVNKKRFQEHSKSYKPNSIKIYFYFLSVICIHIK